MEHDLRYLKSLAKQYPTVAGGRHRLSIYTRFKPAERCRNIYHGYPWRISVSTCIKERFRGDQEKIEARECHQSGRKKSIATLIYYPEQKMEQVIKTEGEHGGLVQGHIVPYNDSAKERLLRDPVPRCARRFRKILPM